MGQYYKIVNLDKKEFIHPHKLGDGLKLLEFGCSKNGTMTVLAILLVNSNGRGGGDIESDSKMVGRWAGDRIVVAGEYGKEGDVAFDAYQRCGRGENDEPPEFRDVSYEALLAVLDDTYICADVANSKAFAGVRDRDAKGGDDLARAVVAKLAASKSAMR